MDDIKGHILTVVGTLVAGIVIGGVISLWSIKEKLSAENEALTQQAESRSET